MTDTSKPYYLVIGVELTPLFGGEFDERTATDAILTALPTRVSADGIVGEVTEAWRMTSEQLTALVNGSQIAEVTESGEERERGDTDRSAVERLQAEPVRSDRKAQSRQRRDHQGNRGQGSDDRGC